MTSDEQAAAQQRYRESLSESAGRPPESPIPLCVQPWLVLAWCAFVGLLACVAIGGCG